MPKTTLTDRTVKHLPLPESGSQTYWDANLSGFGVRISSGGTKSFVVLVARGRRKSIGKYPHRSIAEARRDAKSMLAEKTLGRVHPKHRAYEDVRDEFLRHCEQTKKPATVRDYRRLLTNRLPFGRKSVGDIAKHHIMDKLDLIDGARERQYTFATARAFLNWCVYRDIIAHNPLWAAKPPTGNPPRQRTLSDDELTTALRTAIAGTATFHRLVALLALTGQRKSEIAGLQWDWIDLKERAITIPAEHTKNGREHRFPINGTARDILSQLPVFDSPYVFPAARGDGFYNGASKDMPKFRKETGIAEFTLHDLRRTFSSGLAQLGTAQVVVEKLLNHVTGSQSQIARIYNRYNYFPEMCEAVERWDEHLYTLVRAE